MSKSRQMIIGVDTGGTFTDLVMVEGDRVLTWKVPSTPDDFSRGVLQGIDALLEQAGGAAPGFDFVHSTTVATNALLERKGAPTALITTRGFRDVLEIGRQARPSLYNLNVEKPAPLVPERLRFEVGERVASDGSVLEPLDERGVEAALDEVAANGVQSVAVCLLFSFLNENHERAIGAAAARRGITVSLSCDVLPEFREYERTSTTVANAFVAPVMKAYLDRLSKSTRARGASFVRIMQSNGGSLSAEDAAARPAQTFLSGPAAGVIGALHVARLALHEPPRLITFDMGGTSTDVSLLDGDFRVTTESEINSVPIRVPMMDVHTVGAGGGSIAWLDGGGALHVGPQSAGADPGPACYGRGELPTVTDANLVLGRLAPDDFLGGRMALDESRARAAIVPLAKAMRSSIIDTAEAILRVVNSNMERVIRVISVARGHDPRDFTLFSFGGAGGLHACDLAEQLRIPRVMIPRNPGVLSAWGAISADIIRDYSRTVMLSDSRAMDLPGIFDELKSRAEAHLDPETDKRHVHFHRSLDVRQAGQSYELNVPYDGRWKNSCAAFLEAHERRYGHAARGAEMEIVTARLRVVRAVNRPIPPHVPEREAGEALSLRQSKSSIPSLKRDTLLAGDEFAGPVLVLEDYSTTLLPKGWHARVDSFGNLYFEMAGK